MPTHQQRVANGQSQEAGEKFVQTKDRNKRERNDSSVHQKSSLKKRKGKYVCQYLK